MYRPRQMLKADRRQAVILMVVVILLTLFAVIGIAFVFYSSSEATSSRIWREAQGINVSQPDESPDYLLQYFLGQFIYDVDDNQGGASSAVRGNSLARNMYGWDYDATSASNPNASFNANAFNGVGRLHNTYAAGALAGVDSYDLVNYTYFHNDAFVLDPERLEQAPRTDVGTTMAPALPQPANNIYVGANAPYTYPDKNNMYLAAVAADGTVLQPSFFRANPAAASPAQGFMSLAPTDADWTTPYGKYLILRPRPMENPTFPMPTSLGGDVKNLTGSPGTLIGGQLYNEDSIWMDLGFPVRQAPDGTFYKPLFAALVMDLDNRVNLNIAGNLRASARNAATKAIQAPYAHGSNQGWGRWEINPNWVLSQTNSSGQPEWLNLLLGTTTPIKMNGRYGPNGAPGVGGLLAVPGDMPTVYGQADYDGGDEVNGGLSKPFQLPSATGSPFSPFPTFNGGWGNGTAVERTDHPLLYDYFAPQGDDSTFDISNMKALLVNMGQQASAGTLAQLCPNNFTNSANPTDPQTIRRRNLVTTTSFDFDRPAMMPWFYPANASTPYQMGAGSPYPIGGPATFPTAAQLATPPTTGNGGEFGADWRGQGTWTGLNAVLGRLDLDQLSSLQDYPAPVKNAQGQYYIDTTSTQYQTAVSSRQQLALAIFARLVYVTGAYNPFAMTASTPAPNQAQFDALRWLAQLSANIVDYVDNDDYMTPFPWVQLTNNATFVQTVSANGAWPPAGFDPLGKGWVFGTELPRVVINEAYCQCENDPNDPLPGGKASDYRINFWVELHDPMSNDPNNPNTDEQASVRLQQNGATDPTTGQPTGVYRIAIAQSGSQSIYPGGPGANNNVFGTPDQGKVPTDFLTSQPVQGMTAFQPATGAVAGVDTTIIYHSNGAYADPSNNGDNHGFYLVGPVAGPGQETPTPFPGTAAPPAAPVPTLQSTGLSYTVKPAVGGANVGYPAGHTLFLQRLANPYMPYDPTPTDPNYNPYVTVDFLDNIPTQDARQHDGNGLTTNGNNPTIQWTSFHAWGKPEPYEAFSRFCALQNLPAPPPPNQPQHTFFRHNGPSSTPPAPNSTPMLNVPFHWLPHLDRQLISPMELLEVSGFKPHELTQMFVQPSTGGAFPGQPTFYQEAAPWFQQSTLIYRLFEFLECHDRSLGIGVGGRQVGKININTVWDPEILEALCDAQGTNDFTPNDIYQAGNTGTIFAQMLASRTPGTVTSPSGVTYNVPNSSASPDLPFLPFAAPFSTGDTQYKNGVGLGNTLLRLVQRTAAGNNVNVPLFSAPSQAAQGTHPYIQNELLTKIANNVTTRSNVFALFLTVGFFQVTDATTTPPTLGPEVGAAQNRNIRHQMFAVIDRTNLTLAPTVTAAVTPVTIPAGQASITTTMTLAQTAGTIPTQNAAGGTLNTGAANGTITWQIQPGMSLVVDTGQQQEIVQVQSVSGTSITATFLRNHAANCNITIPGNPGPQPLFDYHSPTYAPVVPYAAILY